MIHPTQPSQSFPPEEMKSPKSQSRAAIGGLMFKLTSILKNSQSPKT